MTTETPHSSAEPAILGLDNIALDLPIAGLGTRSLAMVVDGLALAVISVIWGLLWMTTRRLDLIPDGWSLALALLGYFLIQWAYFFAFEAFFEGRTPGKMALSLQTVSHFGGRPAVSAVLIRNLLRPIDYLVGVFFMALDGQSRRLGDRVAATLVVHREPESRLRRERRLGRMAGHWSASQVALIEGLVNRVERLEPEVARDLASRLLAWMEREHGEFVAQAEAPHGLPADPVERLWLVLAVHEVNVDYGGAEADSGEPPEISPPTDTQAVEAT